MKIHKPFLLVAALSLAIGVAAPAGAATIINLSDLSGPPSAVTVMPGDSFTIRVQLQITGAEEILAVSYWLEVSGLPYVFSITGRDYAGSALPEVLSTNGEVLSDPGLDPSNEKDLGGIAFDLVPLTNGTHFLANTSLSVNPLASDGVHTIRVTTSSPNPSIAADSELNEIPVSSNNYSVTVTTVPEPSAAAFLAAGGLLAVARRMRR